MSDERLAGRCYLCGANPSSRDHVPPKVFLDTPYPENMFAVECCKSCNESFSMDEEYVACLAEVLTCGSSDPEKITRTRISKILTKSERLRSRFLEYGSGNVNIEYGRVIRVAEKVARGLWTFETSEPTYDLTVSAELWLGSHMFNTEYLWKHSTSSHAILPEVGSRLTLTQEFKNGHMTRTDWKVIQPDQFEYSVCVKREYGVVRIQLGSCIAAEIKIC